MWWHDRGLVRVLWSEVNFLVFGWEVDPTPEDCIGQGDVNWLKIQTPHPSSFLLWKAKEKKLLWDKSRLWGPDLSLFKPKNPRGPTEMPRLPYEYSFFFSRMFFNLTCCVTHIPEHVSMMWSSFHVFLCYLGNVWLSAPPRTRMGRLQKMTKVGLAPWAAFLNQVVLIWNSTAPQCRVCYHNDVSIR